MRVDLLLDGDDLLIKDSDFVVGESDMQHIEDTINATPGYWKEYPNDGVDIVSYENSTGEEQDIQRTAKLQLQSDGYRVNPIVNAAINGTYTVTIKATNL